MENALISIYPSFVEAIQSGKKTVELRTRTPKFNCGTRLWIYSTKPVSKIQLVAYVTGLTTDSPTSIWESFCTEMAISRKVFREYCSGHRKVCAISLSNVSKLQSELSLDALRQIMPAFQPPQFFTSLNDHPNLTENLLSILPETVPPIIPEDVGHAQGL